MSNTTWVNDDGLLVRYGTNQGARGNKAGVTQSNSKEVTLAFEATLTGAARTLFSVDLNNDGTLNGFSGLDGKIPSGVKILSQDVIITEALAGGTNYAVGTYTEAGAAVDADGIRVTAGTDGAQIGATSTAAWVPAVVTTGTYTAGKVKVIITYLTV
jgi:hypothetical protein